MSEASATEASGEEMFTLAGSDCILKKSPPRCYVKARHVLAFMGFLGQFNLYSMRMNLSVAIVAMVNSSQVELSAYGNDSTQSRCPDRTSYNSTNDVKDAVFDWNTAEQGLLLGIYFYSYIFTCVPGGYLGTRFGVRPVLGISMLLASILTLLLPVVARASFEGLLALRLLTGFLQGVVSPAMQSAWGRWAPPKERSTLVSFTLSGSCFGAFVTLPIAGFVADTLGWEAVFYVTGGGALVWSIIWLGIIHSSPQNHPRISEQEKAYIVQSIGEHTRPTSETTKTPWLAILTSPKVWAIAVAHFCNVWGLSVLMAMLPTYMATVLRFDLSTSGVLSAIPYLLQFLIAFAGGYVSDMLLTHHTMTTLTVRKLNTTLGLVLPATFLVLAGYVGCDVSAAVAFFALSVGFTAFAVPGCLANTVDIAPRYAGVVYGISNTIANMTGFLGPQVAGMMLLHDNSIEQWRKIFYMSAGVCVSGSVFYLFLASADEQSWSSGKVVITASNGMSREDDDLQKESLT